MTVQTRPKTGRKPSLFLSLSCLALVTGCGGGGGGGDATGLSSYLPDFQAPDPVNIGVLTGGFAFGTTVLADAAALLATPKYQNTKTTIAWLQETFDPTVPSGATQDPLRSSGAAIAHAAGFTGDGVRVAVSDYRMSPSHEAIAGRVIVYSQGPVTPDFSENEHGTSVASVLGGNAAGFVGVAPDVQIDFGTFATDRALADLGQTALALGAVAWNNSWGYSDLKLTKSDFAVAFKNPDLPDSQDYLQALDDFAASSVVVFAVSNLTLNDATLMDGLPYLRNSLEAGWIAAVNGVPTLDSNGDVTSVFLLSNACWQAARWCLIADGSWNAAVGPAASYGFTTGSSFAAPQISGALAILAEAFPTLSPHDLRVRLLASAEDDFFTADDTVELADGYFKGYSVTYGHGFLDIEAALRPIGPTAMSLAEGRSVSTDAPVLRTGSGFGDAVERSLAGTNVAVRDVLSANFSMPAEALTMGARPGSQAGKLLAKSVTGNLRGERLAAPSALADPFAAFSGPVLTLSAPDGGATASVLVPQNGAGSMGFTIAQALTEGSTRVDLGVKLARDDGQIMSLDGDESAAMASVTLGITQDLGAGAFVALSGEMGITDLGGDTALGAPGSARFDAVKLTAGRSGVFRAGDRLSVGVGMPVAVASGETNLTLPVLRQGASAFESVAVDLAPENRQTDFEVTYLTALSEGLEMKLSMIHSDDFGNRAGVTDTGGAIAFTFRF